MLSKSYTSVLEVRRDRKVQMTGERERAKGKARESESDRERERRAGRGKRFGRVRT